MCERWVWTGVLEVNHCPYETVEHEIVGILDSTEEGSWALVGENRIALVIIA